MRRFSAFIVMPLVVSATVLADWQECFGWSSSAAAQHACCATMHDGRADAAKHCCVMAQQSRDRDAGQSRVLAPAPAILTVAVLVNDESALSSLIAVRADVSPPGHAVVPLYVQHHSFLI